MCVNQNGSDTNNAATMTSMTWGTRKMIINNRDVPTQSQPLAIKPGNLAIKNYPVLHDGG